MNFNQKFTILLFILFGVSSLNAQLPSFGKILGLPENKKQKATTEIDEMKELEPDLVSEVRIGKIVSNLKIEALDGSFTLTKDKQFRPTKYTVGYKNPGSGFTKMFKKSEGIKVKIDYELDVDEETINAKGDTVLTKVKKEGLIYGILEFNYVYDECSDLPVTRNYNIDIPYETIVNAMDGKISAAYEYYECSHEVPKYNKKGQKKAGKTTTVKNEYTTWVVFLSDIAF